MADKISDLSDKVTALEAHAAAVNAERFNLFQANEALKAQLAAQPPAPASDDEQLVALGARIDAVSASIVAPVASLAPPAPAADPAPVAPSAS